MDLQNRFTSGSGHLRMSRVSLAAPAVSAVLYLLCTTAGCPTGNGLEGSIGLHGLVQPSAALCSAPVLRSGRVQIDGAALDRQVTSCRLRVNDIGLHVDMSATAEKIHLCDSRVKEESEQVATWA